MKEKKRSAPDRKKTGAVNSNLSPFINRELSWLDFNDRVLQCALDESIPLLERLKFLAITGSNLDEFFMVRVGGLQQLVREGIAKKDPSGLTPEQQLAALAERSSSMAADQYRCLNDLLGKLKAEGIRRIPESELSSSQARHAEFLFSNEILPVLSPLAVDEEGTPPLFVNRMQYFAVLLGSMQPAQTKQKKFRLAVIPVGKVLGRFISLPSAAGQSAFMLIEDLASLFIHRFFPGEQVLESTVFRVIRNADVAVREDGASDLLIEMEAVIGARKRSDCVRLEIGLRTSKDLLEALLPLLDVSEQSIYRLPGPLDLSAFMRFSDISGFDRLRYKPWPPRTLPVLESAPGMFDILRNRDLLLYHPYDSFDPVIRLVREAAQDEGVIAIKQILYRTSPKSPIVAALIDAANRGKYVSAIVELKARFDEERNIEWAQELEDAGVQVIYGVRNLKTHAKLCLVIRRENGRIMRYAHFGTGNYNETTARIYSDVSYFTAREDLCGDASAFFNSITGNSQPPLYQAIEAAPLGLRERILSLIEAETERKRQGQAAFIRAKMNSLTDPSIINALYRASQEGVKIHLNIRGICCLRPGVAGQSENIEVVSIVGRFLEHARILHFANGGADRVFICTADWMQRNLDKRVELLVPVDDRESRRRLLHILDLCFKCTAGAWALGSDGSWRRRSPPSGKKPFNCHSALYEESREAVEQARRKKPTMFDTHKPRTPE